MSAALRKNKVLSRSARSTEHYDALDRLFRRIGELSSLPNVAQRVLKVAQDSDSDAEDLLHVVEHDPTLAIRILQTVNSSYYGLRNNVADLRSAISLLGFDQVRNLALTVYVARLCDRDLSYKNYTVSGLWRHMVVTGSIARLISTICRRAEAEEAYLAGLMHDVGILLIGQYMHKPFRAVIDEVEQGAEQTLVEQRILSFDHTDLGAFVAEQCGLPEATSDAIAYHHKAARCIARDRELLHVLVMADHLAIRRGFLPLGVQNESPLDPDVVRGLGLRDVQMEQLTAQLPGVIENALALSGI